MSSFTLSPTFNKNKVFILHKSELEKRLDPFYYIPTLVELEKKVLAKHPKKLRDYVVSLSSGATPKRDEEEKYYSNETNGIPFLRVQNVTEFGLDLSDVKYINKETHEGYLKRSQVFENDLLVTITGRIASAAVAPKDFIGNINQHSVVIKTESKEISEMLAAYLNCTIGQKLALRNTTGGTRPALDYPALLSIPILNDKRVLGITKKVIEFKKRNEIEAENILGEIDNYLLKELGITLPAPSENILKNRIYKTSIKEISGKRFDPAFHQIYFHQLVEAIENSKFSKTNLGDHISEISYGASFNNFYVNTGVPLLRIKDLKRNEISVDEVVYLPESARTQLGNCFVKTNDFLITRSGTIGLVAFVPKEIDGFAFGSFMIKFNLKKSAQVNKEYLSYFLNCGLIAKLVERNKIGAIQGNITIPIIKSLPLVLPPLDKQKEIAEHIMGIRHKAQQLKDKTKEELKKASEEIEKILLT